MWPWFTQCHLKRLKTDLKRHALYDKMDCCDGNKLEIGPNPIGTCIKI